jgi:hypothetical protein
MDSLGRLLLRVLLVPFGYVAAALAGTLVILLASWRLGADFVSSDPDLRTVAVLGIVIAGPLLAVALLGLMWLPASIGILISEAFAIRSWIYHVGNGVVSAWVGWHMFGYLDDTRVALNDPLYVIAAGIAAGFAYWAIAGWSAGFWKPVFHSAGMAARRVP